MQLVTLKQKKVRYTLRSTFRMERPVAVHLMYSIVLELSVYIMALMFTANKLRVIKSRINAHLLICLNPLLRLKAKSPYNEISVIIPQSTELAIVN